MVGTRGRGERPDGGCPLVGPDMVKRAVLAAETDARQEKGRTRAICVREGVEEVVGPVPAGSSGAVPDRCAGVCDDEKCRYEGGRG